MQLTCVNVFSPFISNTIMFRVHLAGKVMFYNAVRNYGYYDFTNE